jgi:hypothetical protein
VFEKIIRQDVMNFKEYIETKHNNSAATTSGTSSNNQPTGFGTSNTAAGQIAGSE